LSAEETDSGGEGAKVVAAESQELGRVDVGVDDDWIGAASDIVESAAQRLVIAEEVETLFLLQIQSEISRETIGARRSVEELLIGEHVEGESRTRFGGVGEIQCMDDRKAEELRLITAAGIDQLADSGLSQSRSLSKLANLSHNLLWVLFLANVSRNQFGNWDPPPGDPDRLPLGDSFQQTVEMGFGVEDSDSSLLSHVN
jgi:hypothetical protein